MYTLNTHPRPNFAPCRSTTRRFRYRLVENRKCAEWPQNDLKHLSVKSTLCTLNTDPRSPNFTAFRSTTTVFEIQGCRKAQISLSFTLRTLVFQIIKVFGFPIEYNGEFQKFVKNQKLKISKIQNGTFVKNIQKNIQNSKVISGRSSVRKILLS